jgi:hypothetical protein
MNEVNCPSVTRDKITQVVGLIRMRLQTASQKPFAVSFPDMRNRQQVKVLKECFHGVYESISIS